MIASIQQQLQDAAEFGLFDAPRAEAQRPAAAQPAAPAPAPERHPTAAILNSVIAAGEDFEWYPTTGRMIDVVKRHMGQRFDSVMDIGAGDGRMLVRLADGAECQSQDNFRNAQKGKPALYSIEKSTVLMQAQPEGITPVGTEFYEQNLACLPVDYIFCNPPYSDFETWAAIIIESGYAQRAFLVIPTRWKDSDKIKHALEKRKARSRVIHTDHFADADRQARAVVDIVEVSFPRNDRDHNPADPFDNWFNQNVGTFDEEKQEAEPVDVAGELTRKNRLDSIGEMVRAYDEEYGIMEKNYRAIFQLDRAILHELGVSKDAVREGIKKRMAGLKTKYWRLLFERLDAITSRLSTKTKAEFLEKLTARASIAFTGTNAYAVVIWSIKNANKYFDAQLIQLYRDLSTFEGVMNYKSNVKTWGKDSWRYFHPDDAAQSPTHYALDYRIVVSKFNAITGESYRYRDAGGLAQTCHEIIDDIIAVLHNLGFCLAPRPEKKAAGESSTPEPRNTIPSRERKWTAGQREEFETAGGVVLFEVKGHINGNLHLRFRPQAIKALNVEAGRLMGWIRRREDVVTELGYTAEDARVYFNSSRQIEMSNIKLLAAPAEG